MSRYLNAESVLADAKLRLDRFGSELGVLVVEGPDDKRFFVKRTVNRQQVIAVGGRRILLAAHSMASEQDSGMAFVTDCDYEVQLKTLVPKWDLIVSHHADLEAELLSYGGCDEIVVQLVASALDDDEFAAESSMQLRERTVALADPLGRMRQIAKAEGFELKTDIRHHKYRRSGSAEVDVAKLVRAVIQASPDSTVTADEMLERISALPVVYNNCNGHDLVAAVGHVLRDDFAVRGQTVDTISQMLRDSITDVQFAGLPIARRIARWEDLSGRRIFRRASE